MNASIGYAFETPSGTLDESTAGLSELTGGSAQRTRLYDLAGPNDTLHLIADAPAWVQIGAAALSLYGAELVKELAKETWKQRVKIGQSISRGVRRPLQRIITGLCWMKHRNGATATLGIPIREGLYAGIDVPSPDAHELAWRIHLMSFHAAAVRERVLKILAESDANFDRNPDMRSIKISPNEDGTVSISWTASGERHVIVLRNEA